MFLELLEEEYEKLDEEYDELLDMLEEEYGEDYLRMQEEIGLTEDETSVIEEMMVKRVNSRGEVRRTRSRKIRQRRAVLTTGLSKARLRMRGRKAARARKRNPTAVRKGLRKRRKANRRRRQLGLR